MRWDRLVFMAHLIFNRIASWWLKISFFRPWFGLESHPISALLAARRLQIEVLLDSSGYAKLCDMGFARLCAESGPEVAAFPFRSFRQCPSTYIMFTHVHPLRPLVDWYMFHPYFVTGVWSMSDPRFTHFWSIFRHFPSMFRPFPVVNHSKVRPHTLLGDSRIHGSRDDWSSLISTITWSPGGLGGLGPMGAIPTGVEYSMGTVYWQLNHLKKWGYVMGCRKKT